MPRRRRRTKEEIGYARKVDWDYSKFHHHAANVKCNGPCGLVTFCVGRYRGTMRCRECSGLSKETTE